MLRRSCIGESSGGYGGALCCCREADLRGGDQVEEDCARCTLMFL